MQDLFDTLQILHFDVIKIMRVHFQSNLAGAKKQNKTKIVFPYRAKNYIETAGD